ncbi:hypothetical protein AB0J72_27570 [Dactylosporangium sp. NPDC049742]|uniref:hypothetical protein n=1 Tax=Dactylosporangium sp. NPDC049742 TaxID=3154737 RepID=UPI00344683C0
MTPVARWLLYVVAAYLGLLGLTYGMGVASTWHHPPAVALDGFPARVDAPWPWTPTLDSAPVTAVPVAIGGSTPGLHNILTDTEGSVSFVDARGGQRILDVASEGAATPGESLLLSPDGTMVAYPHDALTFSPDSSIAVRTLGDGHIRRLPVPAPAGGHVTPLAWSPHQDRLAVYVEGSSIGVLTLDTGTYLTVLPFPAGLVVTPRTPIAAAFSSDGDLAVQLDTTVCVKRGCFSLPAGQRLAGKGAYTPANNSLAVVTDAGRDSTITFISETNGSPLPGTIHLYGVTTLRLIGWWADRALVVAFRPEPVTDLGPLDDERNYPPTAYALVQRLSILAITPSLTTSPPHPSAQASPQASASSQPSSQALPLSQPAAQVPPPIPSQFPGQASASASPQASTRAAVPTQAQELMVLPDQILSIDIADRALLAGHTSPGHPAPAWPARPGVLTALVGLPAAPIAFIVFLVGAIRRELAAASTTR